MKTAPVNIDDTTTRSNKDMLDGCSVETSTEFISSTPKHLYNWWQTLQVKTQRQHIQWLDVDMMDLFKIAPNLMVKDVCDDGAEFKNRYWGSALRDYFGVDATGLFIKEYFDLNHQEQALTLLRFVTQDNRPVKVTGRADFFKFSQYVPVEACYIPLYDSTDKATNIIVAYQFESPRTSADNDEY